MGSGATHAEAVTIYEALQAMTEAHRGPDAQTAAAMVTLSEVRLQFQGCRTSPSNLKRARNTLTEMEWTCV